jgi:hypothetical protein
MNKDINKGDSVRFFIETKDKKMIFTRGILVCKENLDKLMRGIVKHSRLHKYVVHLKNCYIWDAF